MSRHAPLGRRRGLASFRGGGRRCEGFRLVHTYVCFQMPTGDPGRIDQSTGTQTHAGRGPNACDYVIWLAGWLDGHIGPFQAVMQAGGSFSLAAGPHARQRDERRWRSGPRSFRSCSKEGKGDRGGAVMHRGRAITTQTHTHTHTHRG